MPKEESKKKLLEGLLVALVQELSQLDDEVKVNNTSISFISEEFQYELKMKRKERRLKLVKDSEETG